MAFQTALRELGEQAPEDTLVTHAGLCADTIILTMDGEMPVGDLSAGDRVITRDAGMAVLKEVRHTSALCDAVQIKAGSLGHTRPTEDLIVPCGTQLLIRDWRANALFGQTQVLVAAEDLQDGEFVSLLPRRDLELVELIFDAPHIVYAGGLEVGCQTPA